MTTLPLPLEPHPTPKDQVRFARFVLFLNALIPGILLFWDWSQDRTGANPVNYAIRTTGILALFFLTLSLAVTPLRKITGFATLHHFRRMLGLYAFFYALTHFAIFFIKDRELSITSTWIEMTKRTYLIIGSIGLLAMVPLAATSFNAAIRAMGPARWRLLHKLAYVAAIAGVIHFYMLQKSDKRLPWAYIVIVGIFLTYRIVQFVFDRLNRPASIAQGFPVIASTEYGRFTGTLRVASITQETPDVRTFRLVSENGTHPFSYHPGQYLTFALQIDGKKIYRSYTIASAPTRPGYCEVTIKRDEKGLVSRHMHDTIKQGDLLQLAAPSGKFTFTAATARSVALIAGGVGITPLMSILRSLADRMWDGQIHLLYANKTERDIIFKTELADLQKKLPNLHITHTLTRPDASWTGATGRIGEKLLQSIPSLATTPIYLCGPAEMITATQALLHKLAVPAQNIHTESFGTRPTTLIEAPPTTTTEHTITFARSAKSVRANGRPLLEIAEDAGIQIPSECRSGTVRMTVQDALTPADRANNVILLCQARALEDVTLDA